MTMIGNILIVGGAGLAAVGTFSNLNPGGIPGGAAIAGGVIGIAAGLGIEALG